MEYRSCSAEETEKLGYKLGSLLEEGDVVSLRGSLGAGKTVLAKGIARALGIKESIVSPTFTLVQEYEGDKKLYHLDIYRLSGEDEFESMGGEEFLYPDGITLIEWSEKIDSMLPEDTLFIQVSIGEDQVRTITIEGGKHEYSLN
ncbi:MAG: tRNA (adenosine(37)-N6)-threonylcarbamoyltransferase complex ATPase subunit type 1 TsaE [Spirochaetales bacterium]|nr:tRNA (adenosine(37)-N6)-threonylcarbamoyltransferase complex ATPase subunit type 1 TsaE [Candidatus Physcosoma equi]